MTLVSSGVIKLNKTDEGSNRSIQYEVTGSASTLPMLFSTVEALSIPHKNGLPTKFSDFYSHNQGSGYGGLYCTWNDSTYTQGWVTPNSSAFYQCDDGDNTVLKVTAAGSPLTSYLAQGPAGQPWSGEISVKIWRRARTYVHFPT